jgi:2-polyprenyl-3-methyl-5-hydroxy-6-metoxy-1,4-benzoquinol methylase
MEVHGYIKHIQNQIKGKRVLDIGCLGSFEHTVLLRHDEWVKVASRVVGIDNNREFLELPKVKKRNNIFYCDITNNEDVCKFKETFPLFNHIIATDIIEHVGNITAFLNNTRSLLKQDGTIYMTTPNVRSLVWQAMWDGRMEFLRNDDHICWFDIDTLVTLLDRSGLKMHSYYYCWNEVDQKLAKEHNIDWRSSLGRRIYFHAKRK